MVLRVDHIATRGRNLLWSSKKVAVAQELGQWLIIDHAVCGVSWRPDGEGAVKANFCVGVAEFDTEIFGIKVSSLNDERFVTAALRAGDLWIVLLDVKVSKKQNRISK